MASRFISVTVKGGRRKLLPAEQVVSVDELGGGETGAVVTWAKPYPWADAWDRVAETTVEETVQEIQRLLNDDSPKFVPFAPKVGTPPPAAPPAVPLPYYPSSDNPYWGINRPWWGYPTVIC